MAFYRLSIRHEAIEQLSRSFRGDQNDFKRSLESVTGEPFESLLERFAAAVLLSDFGLKEDVLHLNEIAKTRLLLRMSGFYLLDGEGHERYLGNRAATDWIGSWESVRKGFGEPSVAGDNSEEADVSGWATDFVELTPDPELSGMPKISVRHRGEGLPLAVQLFVYTKGGSMIQSGSVPVTRSSTKELGLRALLKTNRLGAADIEKVMILVTNTDPAITAPYEFLTQE